MVDSGTVEGVGRAVELGVALHAFAATVEVDGARGDGQLAPELEVLDGQKGWRLGLARLTACEVVSPLREAIEQALQEQTLREYLKDVKRWGSAADVWMDS